MAPAALVMSFFSVLTAEVVVLPLDNPASGVAVLSGDEQGVAVVTAEKVVIFGDQATRGGGKPVATLRPRLDTMCADIGAILALENGTLAVGTCPHAVCGAGCVAPAVEIYNSQAVMSSAAPSVVLDNLRGGSIDVMTQLSDGRLVAQSSIFAREALIQGGNATTVLDTKYKMDAVTPFQGGLAYTSSGGDPYGSLLVFDAVALASGGDPDAALEWGGDTRSPPDLHPAKWRIPEHICAGPSHVFADGAIAVLGTCELSLGTYQETAELLLLEDVDLEAQTLKNRSFAAMKGAPTHVLALPGGLIAVGVTTVECDEGHVEIFEESALRSGGEPAHVVKASGDVGSMAVFRDGRLAVSTFVGGFSGGQCGSSGTVDIIDVAAEMRQHSSVSV
jgi:hypothetical protein